MNKFVLLLFFVGCLADGQSVFRYAIPTEPRSLDPGETNGFDSQHLLGNLFRGLFKISEKGELQTEGARACRWQGRKKLNCRLKKLKFSDGSHVRAADYVRAFRHFLRPQSLTTEIELLMNLKNAMKYHEGKTNELGIKSPHEYELEFEFERPDPEFEYKLASPLLFPWKTCPNLKNVIHVPVNGPYKVKSWEKSKIALVPNDHYQGGHPHRPTLEVLFIPDENTLMSLFDTGRLDFIRRLPTLSIARYRNRKGFIARPLSRFDYLGFGPRLKNYPELRKAMTLAPGYDEFKKIFDSLGPPGCPSFPETYMDRTRCYRQRKIAAVPKRPTHRLDFLINQTGGEDLKRGAEWFQDQWKKKLGLEVDIRSVEGKVLLSEIRANPPDIFRTGLSLTRPTCLAALELFKSTSENNLVKINDPVLDDLILKLESSTSGLQKRRNCGRALDRLLSLNALIPLGRFRFFMVVSDQFEGLAINELNHLDLSQLHTVN